MSTKTAPTTMMTPDRVKDQVGGFSAPSVIKAMERIREWAEDAAEEATEKKHPDNGYRRPDPTDFHATCGMPWLKTGSWCKLLSFGDDGASAGVRPMERLGWVRDVRESFPTRNEIAFRFTPAGVEAFADLMYPTERLAYHRSLALEHIAVPTRHHRRLRS